MTDTVSYANLNEEIGMPGSLIPSYRQRYAKEKGIQNKGLIYAIGGLGDVICAEPAIRWALKNYKGWTWAIATRHPELFRHLEFAEVFDLSKDPLPMAPDFDAEQIVFSECTDEQMQSWLPTPSIAYFEWMTQR